MGAIIGHHGLMLAGAGAADGFANTVLADAPYIYYRLGETSGTALADSSGGSRAATIYGTSGTDYDLGQGGLVGDSDASINLKSDSGFVRSDASQTFPASSCTLMVAIKPNASAAAGYIAGLYSGTNPADSGGSRDRELYLNTSGKLVAFLWNGAIQTITSSANMNDNTAKLIHLVVGTTSTTLYVNGASVGSVAAVSTDSGGRYLYGGMNNVSGHPGGANAGMRGLIDELAWFNTALSPTRVLAHAQAAGLA